MRLNPPQKMIMGGHQAICQHIHKWAQILLNPFQEIQIIINLKKHGLTVVAAVVKMIILVG